MNWVKPQLGWPEACSKNRLGVAIEHFPGSAGSAVQVPACQPELAAGSDVGLFSMMLPVSATASAGASNATATKAKAIKARTLARPPMASSISRFIPEQTLPDFNDMNQ